MGDLISRKLTYKLLSDYYHHRTKRQHEALREALDMVPSEDPELEVEVVARLDWIKEHLAWLGSDGTRQQIEMLISDILRDKERREK